jgi:hypothetical protein
LQQGIDGIREFPELTETGLAAQRRPDMTKTAQIQPLQAQCSAASCRRRQNVPVSDLYQVEVRSRGGGTHRDAGWKCRSCGHDNVTPASFLRRGVLATLPSKADFDSARAPTEAETVASGAPEWKVGSDALSMLDVALARIAASGGDAVGLAFENGMQQSIEMPLDRDGLLCALEEEGCHLLVAAGPNPDGSTWQLVLHPVSGAATLASFG